MTWVLIVFAFYVSVFAAYCIGCDVGYDNALREQEEMAADIHDSISSLVREDVQ